MRKIFTILTIALMVLPVFAQQRTIFIHGNVYTVNPEQPEADAVVVEDNKIIFVGCDSGALEYENDESEVIDLDGRLMLPGFIDNHVHFMASGFQLNSVYLRYAKDTAEFKSMLREHVEKYPGRWVTGGDWDHESWDVKEEPAKEWIDPFTENTPVLITRYDGHMALANSKALKIAGITKDTESPDGGLIVKDPVTGEPTGMLKDNAMSLVSRHVPEATEEEYEEAMTSALEEAKRLGVTSVQDITYANDLKTYKRFLNEDRLTCRIYTIQPISTYQKLVEKGIEAGEGNIYLKHGGLKAFADGSLGSATAWFFDPYVNKPDDYGLPMKIVSDGSLEKWAIEADKNNLQICIHAIGDRANSWCLDLYEKLRSINPEWDRRHRIEHAQHVRQEDIKRFAELDVIASVHPAHIIDDGCWAVKRVGEGREPDSYPVKSMLDAGVKVCFGTDWSVAPLNPLRGIYSAVSRRTVDGENPRGWIPEEKISVEDAVKAYTIMSAYGSYDENIKGSIEEGKLADLVILSDNILEIEPEKIIDASVIMTMFDGRIIYNAMEKDNGK